MSKLNRPIPSSAVGAGFACPKTQSKLFSGERNDSIIHVLTQPTSDHMAVTFTSRQ
ncbi:hypothetical protein [uncultured Phocaeicola sp.]|uniref:hypothetical protein n=1 Tax=uncultured Phocaeicola sp. TaxID=990718 RepID=UPI0025A1B0BA|nr:hypothetical protein [uncultured Phocaeicola sp.]